MTDTELLGATASLKSTMIAVATGGPAIESVDQQYIELWASIHAELGLRRLPDPNPHQNLWDWYGRWSDGSLPRYQDRRRHVADLYREVEAAVRTGVRVTQAEQTRGRRSTARSSEWERRSGVPPRRRSSRRWACSAGRYSFRSRKPSTITTFTAAAKSHQVRPTRNACWSTTAARNSRVVATKKFGVRSSRFTRLRLRCSMIAAPPAVRPPWPIN